MSYTYMVRVNVMVGIYWLRMGSKFRAGLRLWLKFMVRFRIINVR